MTINQVEATSQMNPSKAILQISETIIIAQVEMLVLDQTELIIMDNIKVKNIIREAIVKAMETAEVNQIITEVGDAKLRIAVYGYEKVSIKNELYKHHNLF